MPAPYLTEPRYIMELVPLHVIAALHQVEGDAEMIALCHDVADAMLRLRDKLAGRTIRPQNKSAGWEPPTRLVRQPTEHSCS